MGTHFNEAGQFQSDKYPTCPPGKVPLSVEDPMAQDLLYEYAQRRREVDAQFAEDLEKALVAAHYSPDYVDYRIWHYWFQMGERQLQCANERVAKDLNEARPRLIAASFMRWLAGEEVLGNGWLAKRLPKCRPSNIIGHLVHVHRESLNSLREMLRHVGYNVLEAETLTTAFHLMFPQVPEMLHEEVVSMHSGFGIVYERKSVGADDLQQAVRERLGARFDEACYVEALEQMRKIPGVRQREDGGWEYAK